MKNLDPRSYRSPQTRSVHKSTISPPWKVILPFHPFLRGTIKRFCNPGVGADRGRRRDTEITRFNGQLLSSPFRICASANWEGDDELSTAPFGNTRSTIVSAYLLQVFNDATFNKKEHRVKTRPHHWIPGCPFRVTPPIPGFLSQRSDCNVDGAAFKTARVIRAAAELRRVLYSRAIRPIKYRNTHRNKCHYPFYVLLYRPRFYYAARPRDLGEKEFIIAGRFYCAPLYCHSAKKYIITRFMDASRDSI